MSHPVYMKQYCCMSCLRVTPGKKRKQGKGSGGVGVGRKRGGGGGGGGAVRGGGRVRDNSRINVCADKNTNCAYWNTMGLCTTNPTEMRKLCCVSCGGLAALQAGTQTTTQSTEAELNALSM